jgi:hypothetical protein
MKIPKTPFRFFVCRWTSSETHLQGAIKKHLPCGYHLKPRSICPIDQKPCDIKEFEVAEIKTRREAK